MTTDKSIIITSIFSPSEAIKKFSAQPGYRLIVVGDKKTPADWHCDNVTFISVARQEAMESRLAKVLPYNHYCRKMIGYLEAMRQGAECIVDTDDDNIPKEQWSFPAFEGTFDVLDDDLGAVNIYQLYTDQKIWPRGLPLSRISNCESLEPRITKKDCVVGVWQGLADEDPDVDAIYRLTNDTPCYFNERDPIVLGKGTISPFNTQNTMIRKELFPLLYLPTYVTFRFTDILRGLVAQPIMWLLGYRLGFTNATVTQKRNPHDYMKDFVSEIPMFLQTEEALSVVMESISSSKSVNSNLYDAYCGLLRKKIVCENELKTLEAWLSDIS